MKKVMLLLLLFSVQFAFAQGEDETEIEAKLFLPVNVKSTIGPKDTLFVYLVSEKPGENMVVLKAKHVSENVYSFKIRHRLYPRITYVIGGYRSHTVCINNREGDATDNYYFNILLEKGKVDPAELKLVPPCMIQD